jgi:hypothetical protein
MHVEPLRLKGCEAVGNGEELRPDRAEMVQSLLQSEVRQIVGTDFVAQEGGELLVLFDERVPAVSPENVMSVFDLFQCRIEFTFDLLTYTGAEDPGDPGDPVGCQSPESELTAALEDPVDRLSKPVATRLSRTQSTSR